MTESHDKAPRYVPGTYHDGERKVQRVLGERDIALRNGRALGTVIPKGALGFISRQSLVILGSLDGEGRPWASILLGPEGFAEAPAADRVTLDLDRAGFHPADPLWPNLAAELRVGGLFIELARRRRLRVNGRVATPEAVGGPNTAPAGVLEIAVEEAYPNCPKYIQRRHDRVGEAGSAVDLPPARRGTALEVEQRRWIEAADTFFVASAHPRGGVDASHRGGEPGFVRVLDGDVLRIPDYPGNSMYNTLGNFLIHPRAGILFVDFQTHRTLQLTGRVEIQWQADRPGEETAGTRRYWTLAIDEWVESRLPPVVEWELLDASPFNPPSGDPPRNTVTETE